MEIISRLKVKLSIAKRFRDFAKKNGTKNSEALELMIDFFERNNLSPFETLSPSKVSLENLIKKRIDGLIAIFKAGILGESLEYRIQMFYVIHGLFILD